MKKLLISLFIIGGLTFLGAGCDQIQNNEASENNLVNLNSENENISQNEINEENNENSSNFVLFGKATGPNTVEFTWTTPAEIDFSGGFKILSSANPEPKISAGAYWYWIPANRSDAILYDIISGKRYLRICQWINEQCGEYSNEIILEVE